MFRIVLFEPEIPPNTGNVIRLASNAGCELHLIEPLGFQLEDRHLRRAGLDYHNLSHLRVHASWQAFLDSVEPERIWAFSTKGGTVFTEAGFERGDCLLFGAESRGLPEEIRGHRAVHQVLRLPMREGNRSMNLSNAVAVAVYEAWRQNGFAGAGGLPG